MAEKQQGDEGYSHIWKIANEVRGAVDGWDFKQYVLGALFYRFISEDFINYIEGGDDSINYSQLDDSVITEDLKKDAIDTKGYLILPSQLFVNKAKDAHRNEDLNEDLGKIFKEIEASASGHPSEKAIRGLFADFDIHSTRLGQTVKEKNRRLAAILKGLADLQFPQSDDKKIALFGDAYKFLISKYAANAGKSGGEFFTPQHVAKLIVKIVLHEQERVNKIYDPACGSGSLLLQAEKYFTEHRIQDGFFGQEINHTNYNLCRMNMFLHQINYTKFNIQHGDTLTDPHFLNDKPFDAIVSNPPYSMKWKGADDPTLINDDRFAPASVLAPRNKADFAFVMHVLHYLSTRGRAAIVCFPGIFYRAGAEEKIRKYLIDNNYVEALILLPPNLFYGTSITVTLLILAKNKPDTNTYFIDASGEEFFKKETNNNILEDEHIARILEIFASKGNIVHVARSVSYEEIKAKDYNLSVNTYIKAKDTHEKINITALNAEIKETVTRQEKLRKEIDTIVTNLESGTDDKNP